MNESASTNGNLWARWNAVPLYVRIVIAMIGGLLIGVILEQMVMNGTISADSNVFVIFEVPSTVILQLLGALAPPLILIAVTHVLMTTKIEGSTARRLAVLLILNTTIAITIGLSTANIMRPGEWSKTTLGEQVEETEVSDQPNPWVILEQNLPKSILGPLGDKQNIIGVILIAVAFGIAMRGIKDGKIETIQDLVEAAYKVLLTVLHWIINLVPIGVFAIVAKVVGRQGFEPFKAMGAFILAVIVALLLQTTWYLLRIKFFSWCSPMQVLRGVRDALVMAFSTDSSTITMPVTYACLKEKVGVKEESASMGALVGANFNNDGTALYEAMAALFIAQLIGRDLTMAQQLTIVFTSIIASVGAAGIPEAGLVTMTLVFSAVGLPLEYIALLLPVDWFLDRCRTTINVLGDVNVACILDGRTKPDTVPEPSAAA